MYMNKMVKPETFFTISEDLDGSVDFECCPQCGSVGIVHFEDSTTGSGASHRCLKCDWSWDGCTFSNGITAQKRLNDIRMK